MSYRLLSPLTVCLSLFWLGCASDPPPPPAPPAPTQVNLQILPAVNINPDVSNKSAPVLLRIYELKDVSNFNNADFFALFDKEQATLAASLIRKQELFIKPGENKSLTIDPDTNTLNLGFFVSFRNLDNAQWRTVAALELHKQNNFILKLTGNTLVVSQPLPETAPQTQDTGEKK